MSYNTKQPFSNTLTDANEDVPSEAPPSYDEAITNLGSGQSTGGTNPFNPPPSPHIQNQPPYPARPQGSTPSVSNQPTGGYGSEKTNNNTLNPPARPPVNRPTSQGNGMNSNTPHHAGFQSENSSSGRKPEDLYTNNLSLPWRYPKHYYCPKCNNTGYKTKNAKQCKDCWKKFNKPKPTQYRPPVVPQAPIVHPPFNPNVVSLPPGRVYAPLGMYRPPPGAPVIVRPGDPRIGGTVCPRCRGRGMVHFFLDLETCTVCNGMGRVG